MLTLFLSVSSVFPTTAMASALPPSRSFATLTGFMGEIFLPPETEDVELQVSIFINVLTLKNKVKRDLNWAKHGL